MQMALTDEVRDELEFNLGSLYLDYLHRLAARIGPGVLDMQSSVFPFGLPLFTTIVSGTASYRYPLIEERSSTSPARPQGL